MEKMESKHKNILIGALLAVVFVMAVGYAAFAQQLTINGSAEITSTWDVKYDSTKTEATPGVVDAVAGFAGGTTPTVEMTGDDADEPLVARKGNIQFTVTPAATTTMNQNDTVTMKVKAEFISSATSVGKATSASITVNMNASQA